MSKRRSVNKPSPGKFIYHYARPMLTVDAVVLTEVDSKLRVLLIKRKDPPYQGCWALPGGYVNENEQALEAAKRELAEETHLTRLKLKPIGFFDTPGRDPRGWTVSVVHLGFLPPSKLKLARPGDDARKVGLHSLHTRASLAFDHARILRYVVRWLKVHHLPSRVRRHNYQNLSFPAPKKRESR